MFFEYYDGPLRKFLTEQLQGKNIEQVNPKEIQVPQEITAGLTPGSLYEDFKLEKIQGRCDEIEKVIVSLAEKFYLNIGLKWRRVHSGSCAFAPARGEHGPGVLLMYTVLPDMSVSITAENFMF